MSAKRKTARPKTWAEYPYAERRQILKWLRENAVDHFEDHCMPMTAGLVRLAGNALRDVDKIGTP